jgi:putative two-component system response regulator
MPIRRPSTKSLDPATQVPDLRPGGIPELDWIAPTTGEATILFVDPVDVNRRLMRAWLKGADYRILEVPRVAAAWEVFEREKVDLVIVDLMLPEVGGFEFCRMLKSRRATQLIPILILTSVQGMENEVASMESGADEFLIKPLHAPVFRARVRAMLRNKAAIDRLDEAEAILFGLAQAVEQRDRYTGGHCERLARYSVAMGTALGLPQPDLLALYRGGYLHDIGKISVPDAILFKNGPLAPEEWQIMRGHPTTGEQICKPMKSLAPVLPIIRSHHERWDGSGYPDGLRGDDIPLLARILQTADIYDALTTRRPYKPAHPHERACEIIHSEVEYGWRDRRMIALLDVIHPESGPGENGDVGRQLRTLNESLF